mgnify:CR=1 FL=1
MAAQLLKSTCACKMANVAVVSPLLALMRDQVDAARRLGLSAETINSSNLDAWDAIEARIAADDVDLLLIAPERLATTSGDDIWPELRARAVPVAVHVGHLRRTRGLDRLIEIKRLLGDRIEVVMQASPYFEPDPDLVDPLKAAGIHIRRDFVANVSHELRTPLTALMGFIETLGGPARDDEAARDRFLGIMSAEAERMNRLVGDLLSLSRVEADERVRPTTPINVADVLRTAVQNLTPLANEQHVSLRPDFGVVPFNVHGDTDQLLQVFTNLIENAIKYGGSGNTVDICAETNAHDPALRGPALRITIADHGPGIDPLHIPRLTERPKCKGQRGQKSKGGCRQQRPNLKTSR